MTSTKNFKRPCPPRWSTERTDRPTYGAKATAIAKMLRRPMMPWQQHVADVALEVNPDTGRLVYPTVILSVPRQSGKSTLLLSLIVLRGMVFGPRQQIVYTAQTRQAAREKWEEDFIETMRLESGFNEHRDFRVRTSNGFEHLKFNNGSRQALSALGKKSGHGSTLDLVLIDEAFAATDSRADGGFGPPMSTRMSVGAGAQMWIVSTKGTWESTYLNSKLEMGRLAVDEGRTDGVAFFDWSAPDDADLWDEEVWWSCMPALGHTQSVDSIRTLIENMNDEAEARRAFLNISTEQDAKFISGMDVEAWAAQTDPDSTITGRVVVGVDVSPDRSWSSISVAGERADGTSHVELVDHRVGTAWVAGRIASMAGRFGDDIKGVAVEKTSPAGALIPDLESWKLDVIAMSSAEHAAAAGLLYDRVKGVEGDGASVWHLGQHPLDESVTMASRRPRGEAWAWDRRKRDITPLISATLALGALAKLPKVTTSPYERRGFVSL